HAASHEVGRRLVRYDFIERAKKAPQITRVVTKPFTIQGYEELEDVRPQPAWPALDPGQQRRARSMQPTRIETCVGHDGNPVVDDSASPVLVIGNSFVQHFRDLLIEVINLPIRTRWKGGSSTEVVTELAENPKLLQGVRVIVWVTTEQH